ncbi:MAG: SPFH domain-containing protein [Kordiimonadaceae bacterium]|nr:SPFH domain-containing protein [Kordiimonadaceae bacterium]
MLNENSVKTVNGIGILLVLIMGWIAAITSIFVLAHHPENKVIVLRMLLFGLPTTIFFILALAGLFMVQPNQAVALTLFGKYKGSTKTSGLRWANPFFSKKRVSLRVRNFESDKLKVNDLGGSPIEIGAVVVWKVVDSAEALFAVDNYVSFVKTQAESALREAATSYPYDSDDEDEIALRSHTAVIAKHLREEIQNRLNDAGVEVLEARISHLAYAPEIASAMLQRQQAGAIIAARSRIVEGAVGMVEMALGKLKERNIIDLDDERKAAMVSNLLVVLCSDKNTQPIVNAGSIY